MKPKPLANTIAVIGGASHGAARGIALALGDHGATVYCAARTSRTGPRRPDNLPGSVEDTAEEVTARGGRGIPVRCDLSDPAQVATLFEPIEHLGMLVNSAWAANYMPVWSTPFWELSHSIWRETLETLSTYWLTTSYAFRLMTKQKRGLILHVTDNYPAESFPEGFCPSAPAEIPGHRGHILHDWSHEALNRFISNFAFEGKRHKITVAGLNPGFMRTEAVRMHMTSDAVKKQFRYDLSESPEYIGRAVAALAADPKVFKKTGQFLWVADLALEYGFTDIDGRVIPRFDPKAPLQPFPA